MLLHDDAIYQILLWLPVTSLLRFKLVCRTWRALIESSYFIKKHLHLHHYDPSLKDKNRNLIYLLPGKDSPITFALTSIEGFEEPNVCLQLNCSDLHEYFPVKVHNIVSYNGIICFDLFDCKGEQSIYLWNPATKQSRVLPESPTLNNFMATVGFGFDVKNNDYKVVNLIRSSCPVEQRVEVYSLNRSSWRSVTAVFPFSIFIGNPRIPFNNGTCFFWLGFSSPKNVWIICFDFCSEMLRSISLPCADCFSWLRHVSVVNDKIACVSRKNDHRIEMWVFNEYGTVNESWSKLYTIDTDLGDCPIIVEGVSMNGNYIFLTRMKQLCRLNVTTKETNYFTLENMPCSFDKNMVEFKESLVSVLEA